VLLKRAWLDPGADRGAMLSEAEAAVSQASTAGARRTVGGLYALKSLSHISCKRLVTQPLNPKSDILVPQEGGADWSDSS
jgi:hypothetical protein